MLISNVLRFIFTCPLSLALPITFHQSRHTFASHLANAGVPLYIVAKLLGDKSLDMVHRVYTNTERTELTEAMKKLSA